MGTIDARTFDRLTAKWKTWYALFTRVELLSLYPTLIEVCGLPTKTDLDGFSVVPLLSDSAGDWNRPAITNYQRHNHSIRSEHFRYVRYADGPEELTIIASIQTN